MLVLKEILDHEIGPDGSIQYLNHGVIIALQQVNVGAPGQVDDARALLDVSVRSAYEVFVGKVAASRDLDMERVDEITQGRVWIGEDAYSIGLVDQLGGISPISGVIAGMPPFERSPFLTE